MMNKKNNNQKGVSLIITFFIMIIVLSVVLSISILLYGQLKILRNIGNSVVGFYAAESGIEKVLYYDWQVKPVNAERGLCFMFSPDNQKACPSEDGDPITFCNIEPCSETLPGTEDCEPNTCTNCNVCFTTTFGDIKYIVEAKYTSPRPGFSNPDFDAKAKGIFNGTERKINIPIFATD